MSEQPSTATGTAPVCYQHADRQTWVSCGRCGRPLCPDCMHHGPVGIRCAECLGIRRVDIENRAVDSKRANLAITIALGQALVWVALLCIVSIFTVSSAPNILLSGFAGSMVGWSMWRICLRASNQRTVWWAVIIGFVIPLLALGARVLLLVVFFPQNDSYLVLEHMSLRFLVPTFSSCGVCALFAWLLVRQRR